jgi:lactate dehydrogenase-like 2-hydroxyacid dehydrogenase
MGREQLHVVLVSLVSESDPNYATYDAVLSVETDHTGFNLEACNHFNTDHIKVVVYGQFAYPLPEFLKLVERHRVGTDQLEGEQCADGVCSCAKTGQVPSKDSAAHISGCYLASPTHHREVHRRFRRPGSVCLSRDV